MLTNAEAKAIILSNLDDIRIAGISLFLNKLIKRETHGGGIEQFRIKNIVTDTFVTNLEEFKLAIDEASITVDCNHKSDKAAGNNTKSIIITIDNITVALDKNTNEDDVYILNCGSKASNISFYLNYLNDGDTVLPLKIYDIRLF